MRILLSNDDGVSAPGLAALREAVDDLGEVTIVAPQTSQSATGHSITLQQPITVHRVRVGDEAQYKAISIDGSPADCVRLAFRRLMDDPPELVLSGINEGANVGINVFYSGTVAAAAEAALLGIPAVAFSAAMVSGAVDYKRAGRLCRRILGKLLDGGLDVGQLVNVNVPDLKPGFLQGVRVCPQSLAGVKDIYHDHDHPEGHEAYQISDDYAFLPAEEESDVVCLASGYVTITPLQLDMTAHDRTKELEQVDWGDLNE